MSRGHSESRTGFRATFRPLLDDRGDAAGRISRKDLLRAARSENVAIQSIATRLKHAMKSEGRRMTPDRVAVTIAAVIGVFVATSLINALLLPSLGFGGAGIGLLVFVGMIALAHVVVQWYVRRGALNQLARTAVAEGVCGSCAFPLEGVPVGEDARVVCPECGAAWANERIVEPFWERPATDWLEGGFRAWITPGVLAKQHLFAPDDRGRFVQTPDSRLVRVPGEVRGQIPDSEWRRIRRATRRVGIIGRWLLMLCLIWLPALCVFAAWNSGIDQDIGLMWFFVVLATMFGSPILLIPFGAAFSTPHRTSRAIVRLGRCGCCLSPLAAATCDGQGRSICGTCGSAWLADKPAEQSMISTDATDETLP